MDKRIIAATWFGLEKIAGKEADRSSLAVGTHALQLSIDGRVMDQPISLAIDGTLAVAPNSTRADSSGPSKALLVGWILAKLNTATREKILRELPELWAEHKETLPDLDQDLVAATSQLLKRMRAKKRITISGAVSPQYRLTYEP